ncbi:hypothetical protein DF3PA_70144 [Candidatus Defluviicoccus seviourii]|uniref:Tyr recombinase domain-containing protein n=1 Tax=Candidatus Defluviicoccus seviourii TaxID=2565273 RepID=A0A564WJM8_9PROT|nr:hypothetical protein DF3PA_70144 [Candidatus Defluviicoccus seviourii]
MTSELARLRDGHIILFRDPRSKPIQARLKIHDKWVWVSTRQTDLDEAKLAALKLYENRLKSTPESGPPPLTLDSVCHQYRQNLLEKPIQKPIYTTYLATLENHILPILKNKTAITKADLERLYKAHRERLGRTPAKSTVNCLNVVLRGLLSLCREQNIPVGVDRLTIKDRGVQGVRRDTPSIEQYRTLYQTSRKWKREPHKHQLTYYKRAVFHELILLITNTGIRPGEHRSLLWSDVAIRNGQLRLVVRKSKVGRSRPITARNPAKRYIERLRALTGHHKHLFCMPDGSPFRDESHMFTDLCVAAKLPHFTLYSLRHFYATQRVLHRVPYELLAKQMGTSIGMLSAHYDHALVEAFPEHFAE